MDTENQDNISDLDVIASAVNADTLAVATSELVGKTGTQLQLDAEIIRLKHIFVCWKTNIEPDSLSQGASVIGSKPGMKSNR